MIPVRRAKTRLPLRPMGPFPGKTAEFDVRLKTLRCKVLVFRDSGKLRRGWRKLVTDEDIGPHADGVVSDLVYTVESYKVPGKVTKRREVDQHYFAIMGLHLGALGVGVLAHEAVHAALAYTRRVGKRNPWQEMRVINREETLAYPVGVIMARLVESLYRVGCYDGKEVIRVKKKPVKKRKGGKC